MQIIGLRRLTYAILEKDTPLELTYRLPAKPLARGAIELSGENRGRAEAFFTDGGLAFECGEAEGAAMTLRCTGLSAETLAEVTGSYTDANGVLLAGDGGSAPLVALGWECCAVSGTSHPADTPQTAYEKVWVYKCRISPGAYIRHRAESTPVIQAATLRISVFKPLYAHLGGKRLMSATAMPGSGVPEGVLERWFEEPYVVRNRK